MGEEEDLRMGRWSGILSKVSNYSPQYAFAELPKNLQSELMHLQRATSNIGPLFAPAEEAISTHFLRVLICTDPTAYTPQSLCTLLSLQYKLAVIGVPIISDTADTHHATSTACTDILTSSLLGR